MSETTGRSWVPPPIPNILGLILGWACNRYWPWPIAHSEYVLPVGVLLVGLTVVLGVTIARSFKQHGTPENPYKETTAIVDTGPFRFSRNPAYITVQIFHAALGFLFNNMWMLLMIPPALITVHYVIVLGEEEYLERKFGDAYLDYKSWVRRWI